MGARCRSCAAAAMSGLRRRPARCVRASRCEPFSNVLKPLQNFPIRPKWRVLRGHLRPMGNLQVYGASFAELRYPYPDHDPGFLEYGPNQLKIWDLGRGVVGAIMPVTFTNRGRMRLRDRSKRHGRCAGHPAYSSCSTCVEGGRWCGTSSCSTNSSTSRKKMEQLERPCEA